MYIFATENKNFEDLSSGRVLYGAPGATNFPVRLALEIFLRAKSLLQKNGNSGPYTVYDPFCGAGYLLTVLGFLCNGNIASMVGSDVDLGMLKLAEKNLSLLTTKGLLKRKQELEQLYHDYKKQSHKLALLSDEYLLPFLTKDIPAKLFQQDIVNEQAEMGRLPKIDLIITDLPYGKLAKWHNASENESRVQLFLNNVKSDLKNEAVVAIVSDKKEAITHDGFSKLKSFKLGKRKISFFSPTN